MCHAILDLERPSPTHSLFFSTPEVSTQNREKQKQQKYGTDHHQQEHRKLRPSKSQN